MSFVTVRKVLLGVVCNLGLKVFLLTVELISSFIITLKLKSVMGIYTAKVWFMHLIAGL